VRASGVVIELDEGTLARLATQEQEGLRKRVQDLFTAAGYSHTVAFTAYRIGSAFLHFKAKAQARADG
jgi:hypothetical protein